MRTETKTSRLRRMPMIEKRLAKMVTKRESPQLRSNGWIFSHNKTNKQSNKQQKKSKQTKPKGNKAKRYKGGKCEFI